MPAALNTIHVILDGNVQGPFSREQILEMVGQGQLLGETPAWKEGLADWKRLDQLVSLPSIQAAVAYKPAQSLDIPATRPLTSQISGHSGAVAPLTQPIPKKSSVIAFFLPLVFGPFGLFYFGWRYGVAAIGFCMFFAFTVSRPWVEDLLATAAEPIVWQVIHNIVLAIMAAARAEERNSAIERGDATAFDESKGMVMAVVSAQSAYHVILVSVFFSASIIAAFKLVLDGRIGLALFGVFVVFPLASVASVVLYWCFSFILIGFFWLLKTLWYAVTGRTGHACS